MSRRSHLALQLEAKQLRLASVADRIRKRLHGSSYWRDIAARHSLNGVTRKQLSKLLARELHSSNQESAVVALPEFEVRGTQCFYGGNALGAIDEDLAKNVHILQDGGTPPNLAALLKAGLAVQTRASASNVPERALIVSPHRDDSSLSIGGIMVARAKQEAHTVCNVFTTSSWLGQDFPPCELQAVSRLRKSEEFLSRQVLGATGVGLGLWEADIRTCHRCATENYSEREDAIFEGDPTLRSPGERDSIEYGFWYLMEQLCPSRVYFPLGLGSHIDHLFLSDFGKAKLTSIATRYPACRIYFYEDLPYATYKHIDVNSFVSLEAMNGAALAPEYEDISEHFEAKIQAIAAHRSQFRRSENEDRLRTYAELLAAEAGFGGGQLAERVWRVQP
tara:strand:- start:65310 stop:66485 length:1176 start_codon:yes stop_codon:yes gene_type:complete